MHPAERNGSAVALADRKPGARPIIPIIHNWVEKLGGQLPCSVAQELNWSDMALPDTLPEATV